jgi:hypothetical protein
MDARETHTELQKNPESEPQFEGVIWSDGTVTLRWLTALRSHSVWESLADCLGIHGHPEYGTEIVWHDHDEPPAEWQQQVASALAKLQEQKDICQVSVDETGTPTEFVDTEPPLQEQNDENRTFSRTD